MQVQPAVENYHIYSKLDRQAGLGSVDPDQMLWNAASDQDLFGLPLIQQFLIPSRGSKTDVQNLGQV